MSKLEWSEPQPALLERISPTTLNAFEQCPKRLAFRRDPNTRNWSKVSTRSALGVVAHALTEAVLRGNAPEPGDRRSWLEQKWDGLVAEQVERLRLDWPGRLVPEPERWRGYLATRTRLLRRMESEIADATRRPSGGGANRVSPLPWVELCLVDINSGLFGVPDLVEEKRGSLRVVDLKSGVHQGDVTVLQRRQLLLYAHLVEVALNRLPDQVLIQDVRGREYLEEVPREDVAHAVESAVHALASFNSMVASRRVFASPEPDRCTFCEFRVVCKDYWEERSSEWPTVDTMGVVDRIEEGVVVLTPQGGGDAVHRVIPCEGVCLEPGDEIAAVDLDRAGPATGRMRWDSRLRIGRAMVAAEQR